MVLAGASLLVYPLTQWHLSVHGGFWKFFLASYYSCSVRCSHLQICALFPPGFVLCSPVSGVWVLLLEYRELDYLGDAVGRNAWLDCGDTLCLRILREILWLLLCAWLDSGYMFYISFGLLTNFCTISTSTWTRRVFFLCSHAE